MAARGTSLLLLLALAQAGGVVAYAPLLTLLLPARLALLAGDARIEWLSAATLGGAIAASIAGILWGWASDVTGTRRAWTAAGLVLTLASLAGIAAAPDPPTLLLAVIAFQVAVNMLLAPLSAWTADMVPEDRLGLLGGLLGAGPPIGALAGVVATLPVLQGTGIRLAAVGGMTALMVLPLLFATLAPPGRPAAAPPPGTVRPRGDFALLWGARLLVQIAVAVLFAFCFYFFRSLPDPPSENGVAGLTAGAVVLSFPVALLLGRLSDRLSNRRGFLLCAIGASASGLAIMASPGGFTLLAGGYTLFACGSSVFLALHSSYALRFLPSTRRRGRDLGVLNLANTFPAILAPLLTLALVPAGGFATLLILLAALVLIAGLLLLLVRRTPDPS